MVPQRRQKYCLEKQEKKNSQNVNFFKGVLKKAKVREYQCKNGVEC
jgi:hypothetical protein